MTATESPVIQLNLREALDSLDQHVLILDSQAHIKHGNSAWNRFARTHGIPPEIWENMHYAELCARCSSFYGQNLAELKDNIAAVSSGIRSTHITELHCSSERTSHWFSAHINSLPNGGAIVMHHDISNLRIFDHARIRFEQMVDASTDAIFVVDASGTVGYANDAARRLAGALPRDGNIATASLVDRTAIAIAGADGSWRGEVTINTLDGAEIPVIQDVRRHESPERDGMYFTVMLHDISAEKARESELEKRNTELQFAYSKLKGTQDQLLQSEKMASIGQLAAGVAHEINNPIGYVHSNIGTLKDYTRSIFKLLSHYETVLESATLTPEARRNLDELRARLEIDYLSQDLPSLLDESSEGIERVRKIVQDLKDFSHVGHGEEWISSDLHRGLDSTLNIVWNELKYKTEIIKDYGPIPPVVCIPSQLNQVFLNILVNAGHAIAERGTIKISTGSGDEYAWIAISDTGSGIPEDCVARIFDPFFTTKAVGEGTGLGLSLSYSIVQKHGGRIEVESKLNQGTTFRIILPIAGPTHSDRNASIKN
jgi:two-component system NtrC family sensor kinase